MNTNVQNCEYMMSDIAIETLRDSAAASLAKILLQHSKNSNRWFYAIKLHHTHETSLSHFLEMSNSDMYELLQLIGLMSPQQRIKIESFKVIINQYLPNVNIYYYYYYYYLRRHLRHRLFNPPSLLLLLLLLL